MRIKGFPNLLTVRGEEWVRLLASEANLTLFTGWCERCQGPQLSGDHCPWCQEALVRFDAEFWQAVGQKIRRALATNHTLLPEVKAAWKALYGDQHHPHFPAGLAWLARAWTDAGNPPHRPFDPKLHYDVANWIRSLQNRGLSHEEIVDIMDGTFEDDRRHGPITRARKDYANIAIPDLRMLRQNFKEKMGNIPGSMLNRAEMWRTLEWVDRQRANPMARLRGERVRNRLVKDGPSTS